MNETNDINEIETNEVPADSEDNITVEEEAGEENILPDLTDPATVKLLKDEVDRLRLELTNTRAAYERLSGECEEFAELYPGVPVTALPDSVWKSFKSGVPLAAAYALYEKKESVAREKALNVNEKNKQLSSGSLYSKSNDEFFTPAEVRAMSASEVKANYAKIITSMSKWH